MKTLVTMVGSAMFLTASLAVYGQNDPMLAKNDQSAEIEPPATAPVTEVKIEKAPVELTPAKNESFKIVRRPLMQRQVGPHGEDLIIKGNKFYYVDEKGKKVKVRKNELKEMPKHS